MSNLRISMNNLLYKIYKLLAVQFTHVYLYTEVISNKVKGCVSVKRQQINDVRCMLTCCENFSQLIL